VAHKSLEEDQEEDSWRTLLSLVSRRILVFDWRLPCVTLPPTGHQIIVYRSVSLWISGQRLLGRQSPAF
jgi:hypothetical protein